MKKIYVKPQISHHQKISFETAISNLNKSCGIKSADWNPAPEGCGYLGNSGSNFPPGGSGKPGKNK